MKRSKSILKPHSCNTTWFHSTKPLYISLAGLVLVGCGEPDYTAIVANTVDDCVADTNLDFQQCEVAYQEALNEAKRTGPSFFNEQDCEWEFGAEGCYQDQDTNFFFPLMAGYLIADSLFDYKKKKYRGTYTPVFGYKRKGSKFHNNYMYADGKTLGSMRRSAFKVSGDSLKPKPKFSRTVSRGGFGKVAAQKVQINQRKSTNRSRSWGG